MSQSTIIITEAEKQATASVTAPASKSVSHRYLIGAALAQGVSTVRHTLESRDLERTRAILCGAGASMETLPESTQASGAWRVTGMGGKPLGGAEGTPLSCDVEESGTTCRLLTAVLAAGEGEFRIHGAPRMHERPIAELTDSLSKLGLAVTFEGKADCPPLVLHAKGLNPALCGGEVTLGMDISSQYFSGLLLAAPMGPAPLSVTLGGQKAVSWPYVGLTLQCLTDYAIHFDVETRDAADAPWEMLPPGAWRELKAAHPGCLRVTVHPGAYRAGNYTVEGDWSGASYLLAAGALGLKPVRVEGLRTDSLQGDRAMLGILQRMGARMTLTEDSVTVYPSSLHGVELDMGDCPDLVPTVAVLAAFAQGSTRISNVAHLRYKESDRISAPAQELAKAGVVIDQLSDGMLIHGLAGRGNGKPDCPRLPEGVSLSAHNDHRIAMSLALLGLRQPETNVRDLLDDPLVVRKSFPQFWNIWEQLA
ncbi:3-phosphoshikimate 1-carboxyvinyltransferase [Desulfovibrio desulfuricans]|uniref:3-phosphoshikimate 1-carboxyvinyltransferase n=1 Tax=Desulfovibrio desulfuricans TaxID=876 RepID=UPI001AE5E23F|nr:3-phosphoshikimate 1-carboxyvinyltransferase [Desulfovibrio desulfuricans]MDD3683234.1 3-phosphoshikimate 1-carboxyvinyltransferase [Desulfovibrio desulfuricans]QTO40678.1 3-phosphoshikimate 1-carboxyvinyltransferase [Desulfovibrio desulfuricans]